jgi:hypothetical protein
LNSPVRGVLDATQNPGVRCIQGMWRAVTYMILHDTA